MEFQFEPLQILVMLEDVRPTEPHVTMIEPGVLVEVTGRWFHGFVGRVIDNPFDDRPFTVCVQQEEDA